MGRKEVRGQLSPKTNGVGHPPAVGCGQLVSAERGEESSSWFGAEQRGPCAEELEGGGTAM
jgi:hypothetical protein